MFCNIFSVLLPLNLDISLVGGGGGEVKDYIDYLLFGSFVFSFSPLSPPIKSAIYLDSSKRNI